MDCGTKLFLQFYYNIVRYHLEKDDLEQALRYMNLLTGEPQLVSKDWLQDLRLHLEAVQATQAILTYATVQAIESM
jgi:mitofilin